ncbi:MAG: rhomboid family intramembrane serine protease [Acidobacteria bacterium]|nr:rhomboid family intramembrane serine protease [Acidobacteriota bacterium]
MSSSSSSPGRRTGPRDFRRGGASSRGPSLWSAVTAVFVHADLWHLAGNMIFLLATGPFLEDAYGRVLFPVIYLGSAISGCYAWAGLGADSRTSGIGASGAVFGVEGAFAVRFGTRYLRFFLAPLGFLPFLGFRIRVRAAVDASDGFVEQWLLVGSPDASIGFGAHVGGFAFGMLAAVAVWAAGIERRRIHPAIEAQIGWQQHPLLVRAREARFAGNPAHARRDVRRLLWEDPANADAWALAARLALDLGDGAEAVRCAGRAIPLYLGMRESDPAADVALEVLRRARPYLSPRFGGLAAALMERRGQTVDAISIYEEVAARFPADDAGRRAAARLSELRPRVFTTSPLPGHSLR